VEPVIPPVFPLFINEYTGPIRAPSIILTSCATKSYDGVNGVPVTPTCQPPTALGIN